MRTISSLLFAATALAIAIGCSDSRPSSPIAAATRVEAANVPASPAVDDSMFVASGPIVVENQVDVMAQREGVVWKTFTEPGDAVHKGQALGELDNRQLLAERQASEAHIRSIGYDEKNWEAKVKMGEIDLERAEKMMAADLITREQLDHERFKLISSRNELERERQDKVNAEAALRSLDLEIEKTRISAPFDGVVARRYVRAGQKVTNGDRLFWITAVAPLRVKFTLPERFVGHVKKGDLVEVSPVNGPADLKHAAKVIQVSPVIDPASGTIEVVAELAGPPEGFRPGMTASVRLQNRR